MAPVSSRGVHHRRKSVGHERSYKNLPPIRRHRSRAKSFKFYKNRRQVRWNDGMAPVLHHGIHPRKSVGQERSYKDLPPIRRHRSKAKSVDFYKKRRIVRRSDGAAPVSHHGIHHRKSVVHERKYRNVPPIRRHRSRAKSVKSYKRRRIVKRRNLVRRQDGIPHKIIKKSSTHWNLNPYDTKHRKRPELVGIRRRVVKKSSQRGNRSASRHRTHSRKIPLALRKVTYDFGRDTSKQELELYGMKRREYRSKKQPYRNKVPLTTKSKALMRFPSDHRKPPYFTKVRTREAQYNKIEPVFVESWIHVHRGVPIDKEHGAVGRERDMSVRFKGAGQLEYEKGTEKIRRKSFKKLAENVDLKRRMPGGAKGSRDDHRDHSPQHYKTARGGKMPRRRVRFDGEWHHRNIPDIDREKRRRLYIPRDDRHWEDLRRIKEHDITEKEKRREDGKKDDEVRRKVRFQMDGRRELAEKRETARPILPKKHVPESKGWLPETDREQEEARKREEDEESERRYLEEVRERRQQQREIEEQRNRQNAEAERLCLQEEENERLRHNLGEEDGVEARAKNDPSVDLGIPHVKTRAITRMRSGLLDQDEDSNISATFYDWENPVSQDRIGFHVRQKVSDYNEMVKKLAIEAARGNRQQRSRPDTAGYRKRAESFGPAVVSHGGIEGQKTEDARLRSLRAEEDLARKELGEPNVDVGGTFHDSMKPVIERRTGINENEDHADSDRLKRLQDEKIAQLKQLHDTEKEIQHLRDAQDEKLRLQHQKNMERLKDMQMEVKEGLRNVEEELIEQREEDDKSDSKGNRSARHAPRMTGSRRTTGNDAETYFDSDDLVSQDKIGFHVRKKKTDYEKMLERKFGNRHGTLRYGDSPRRTGGAPHSRRRTTKDFNENERLRLQQEEEIKRLNDKQEVINEGIRHAQEGTGQRSKEDWEEESDGIRHVPRTTNKAKDGFGPGEANLRTWRRGPAASAVTYYDSEDLASEDEIGFHALEKRDDYERMLRRKFGGSGHHEGHGVDDMIRPKQFEDGLGGTKEYVDVGDDAGVATTAVTFFDSDDNELKVLKKRDDYGKLLERKYGGRWRRILRTPKERPVGSWRAIVRAAQEGARHDPHKRERVSERSAKASPWTFYDSKNLASENEIKELVPKKKRDYKAMLKRKFGWPW